MRTRLAAAGVLGSLGALLSACATSQPDVPRGSVNIFFSPSGEPFRGGRNDPYPVDIWFSRADSPTIRGRISGAVLCS